MRLLGFVSSFLRLSGQPQTKLAALPTCAQMESKPPTLLIKKASFLCATTLQREEKSFTFKSYKLYILQFVGNISTHGVSAQKCRVRFMGGLVSSSLELLATLIGETGTLNV